MRRFKSQGQAQRFLSVHRQVHNLFFASGGISFEPPIIGHSEGDHLKCDSRRRVPVEQEHACQQASPLLEVG